MTDKALATYQPESIMPSTSEWALMRDMAKQLLPTGFLPYTIKTPEQAVAIMLKGRELRIPPMYALSNLVIVKGKVTSSAELMLALIYRDHGKRSIRIASSDDTQCTVEYRLTGWPEINRYQFTWEQAGKAGLLHPAKDKNGDPTAWHKYPAAMLRARCVSAVARMAFPESISGMYVPGELGEPTTVTDEGVVISIGENPTHTQITAGSKAVAAAALEMADPYEPDRSVFTEGGVDEDTGEIEEIEHPDDGADWTRASNALHAWGRDIGMDHSDIHYAAQALFSRRNIESIRDLTSGDLRMMRKRMMEKYEEDPARFSQWIVKITPAPETTEVIEAEGRQLPGMDDIEDVPGTERVAEAARR